VHETKDKVNEYFFISKCLDSCEYIDVLRRPDVTGDRREVHSEGLHSRYSSENIIYDEQIKDNHINMNSKGIQN
jgi:hypothetical protein